MTRGLQRAAGMKSLTVALLLGALSSVKANQEDHLLATHVVYNASGHVIPKSGQRAGNNDASDHVEHRTMVVHCHGIQQITLTNGEEVLLESPGYPGRYPNRKKCGWDIRATDGSTIDITCPVFDLQKASKKGKCKFDYLSLDGMRFCGSESMSSTITGGDLTKIRFRSNGGKNNFDGFQCRADALAPATPPPAPAPSCACGEINRARIVGGSTTEVNEYPWQAALVSKRSSSVFCGGTLINDRFVLTAAHCTEGLRTGNTQVLLGNHLQNRNDAAEKRVNVKRIIDHPFYNNQNLNRDFSLLELSEVLDLAALAPEIMPACLPETTPQNKYDNVDAIITGWGALSTGGQQPNALQEVVVKTMTNSACNNKYGNGEIQPQMLCASEKGKDACQGDSGGPLVTDDGGFFSLIGVVSWGYDCADPNFPGVYSRVTSELDWITTNSRSGGVCAPGWSPVGK